jgi:hydroxyacylglutathione hydrolase
MTMLAIEPVACLSDNYAYLIHDAGRRALRRGRSVRTGPRAQGARRPMAGKLTHILNTHHHFDHTGGNSR